MIEYVEEYEIHFSEGAGKYEIWYVMNCTQCT